ncbi:hypothetical protein CLV62_101298 [Dysgonomonas alginatilytica]|uniref:Uncharacterized protein n=1 Tax=Dysgonomonas alginatilytica TaxID=1605892 RepID=A0A2V3PTU1_9BACT|nr:hypothetical protein [Dysgonomonas alginatilytica]PXV69029.1 hypothetical protein CLV62_101298 [Dysgonomonas alginatilytica]
MLKYRILFINIIVSLVISLPSYCQIGINTENPKYLFHLDGLGNNATSGSVSASQLLDDVVVDNNGNVGLGAAPTVKLEVKGSLFLAGTGLEPEMRLISDANGYATWRSIENLLNPIEAVTKGLLYGDPTGLTDPNVADPARTYTWTASQINAWTNLTRTSIKVTPGTWLVYASMGLTGTPAAIGNNFFWMQLRNKTTGAILETVGNLHEFTGGGWAKPQFMKLIVFQQNAELEIWVGNEAASSVNNRYGGSHFGAIKIL